MKFCEYSDFDKKHILSQIFKRNNFKYMSNDDVLYMLDRATILNLKKDEFVYWECQENKGFYFVLSGDLLVYKTTDKRNRKIFSFLHEGSLLGISEMFTKKHVVAAKCNTSCQVALIEKDVFFNDIAKNNNILLDFLMYVSESIRSIKNSIVIESAETKIRNYLVWIIKKNAIEEDGKIKVYRKHTHEQISEMLGLSRETITKSFTALKKDGEIDIENEYFVIKNKDLLDVKGDFNDAHIGFYGSEG